MVIRVGVEPDPLVRIRVRQGELIRKTRQLHGLSIADLAEKVGATVSAVSHWETGRFTPSTKHQIRIASVLGVPHGALFGLDGEVA